MAVDGHVVPYALDERAMVVSLVVLVVELRCGDGIEINAQGQGVFLDIVKRK